MNGKGKGAVEPSVVKRVKLIKNGTIMAEDKRDEEIEEK